MRFFLFSVSSRSPSSLGFFPFYSIKYRCLFWSFSECSVDNLTIPVPKRSTKKLVFSSVKPSCLNRLATHVQQQTHINKKHHLLTKMKRKKGVSSTTKKNIEKQECAVMWQKKHKQNYVPLIIMRRLSWKRIELTRAGIQVCE